MLAKQVARSWEVLKDFYLRKHQAYHWYLYRSSASHKVCLHRATSHSRYSYDQEVEDGVDRAIWAAASLAFVILSGMNTQLLSNQREVTSYTVEPHKGIARQ